jgi:hypothetical protein
MTRNFPNGTGRIFPVQQSGLLCTLWLEQKILRNSPRSDVIPVGAISNSRFFRHDVGEDPGPSMKSLLMADRRESLSVIEENGRLKGYFSLSGYNASYLSRKMLQEIEPVEIVRKGTGKRRLPDAGSSSLHGPGREEAPGTGFSGPYHQSCSFPGHSGSCLAAGEMIALCKIEGMNE